jgi:hypothetical protein
VEELVVVISTLAEEFLRRLPQPERELFKKKIVAEIRSQHERVIPVADSSALMIEVLGYVLTYRPLTGAEKKVYDAADGGYFVSTIKPLWSGYQD